MNISNVVAPYKFDKKWNVSMLLGAGFLGYRSILYNGAKNDSIVGFVGYDAKGNKQSLIYKSYFNIGANIAYKITKNFDIFFELSFTSVPIDDLDAKAVSLSELDGYGHTTLGLHYTFGKHDLAYKWNPKPCYFAEYEDEVYRNEQDIVDLGNRVSAVEKCCAERNTIDPCDTSTVDTDGDAVPDCRDLEKDSPKGSIVNFQGIALVVKDSTDGPGQGGAMQRRGGNAPSLFFSPIFFEYDKSTIDSSGEFTIINVALYMKQYPNSRILISGNCDSRASDSYNDNLSKRRCGKALRILTKEYGIDADRFELQPNGKRNLLFPKHHANRRVDFSVIE
jgi:outer membrane protein OmpA-like peptidoglycan-associated protein